jgi:hypothetical protein
MNTNNIELKCKICNREFTGYAGLGHHIVASHKINIQIYYDEFYTNEKLITNEEFRKNNPNKQLNTNLLQPTIDHKLSIFYGFNNEIPANLIGFIDNLCICSRLSNCQKQKKIEFQYK